MLVTVRFPRSACTQPTCFKKLFSSTLATGNPHRILSKVMQTMTNLTADNISQRCQLPKKTTSTSSLNLLVSSALKADNYGTKCKFSTSANNLCEIPTRISQCNLNDAVINQHANDNERSPHLIPTSPATTIADTSNSIPSSLPPPDTDDDFVYKQRLAAIYDIFERMQQRWPLPAYLMQPIPSTPDAPTASLHLASPTTQATLTIPESPPSSPCSSAPTTFREHLTAFTNELERMRHRWPLPAEEPQPVSSFPVPTTPESPTLESTQQFIANAPSTATARNTTTPPTIPEPRCDQPEASKPLSTAPISTVPCPQQQIQSVPFTIRTPIDKDSNFTLAAPSSIPLCTPDQPTPSSIDI